LTMRNDILSSCQSPSLRSQDHGESGNVTQALPQAQTGQGIVQLPTDATHNVATELNISSGNGNSAPTTSTDNDIRTVGSSLQWDERWPMVGHCSLTDDEVELLRHYNHFVSPWVSLFRCCGAASVHFLYAG
jgi:hypothetical protein